MTDKPFKEPKVGGKLDAAVPWMMAVGTLLAVAGFVLTFTLAPLVNGAAVSEPQVIAGTVVANKLLISQKIFYWHVPVAISSFAAVMFSAFYGVRFLMTKRACYDVRASICMEIALVFVLCVMASGELWERAELDAIPVSEDVTEEQIVNGLMEKGLYIAETVPAGEYTVQELENGADYNVYYYAAALKNLMQENFELAQSDTFILENGRDAVVLVFNEKVLPELETVTVTAAKVWDDGDSAERPASTAVQLLANGEPYGEPATLSAESGWTCAWEVPETDESGAAIVYTVREVSVPDGYEVSYSVAEDGTLVITNTLKKAESVTPTDPETPTTPETPAQTGAKSGDGFQLWLYAAAGVLALAGAAALVILPNRRHGKREAK